MARGMVVNEPIVSQANSREFAEGYDRVYGADRKPQRGRWVWDEQAHKLVNVEDYVPPSRAVDAPVMVGWCHEGQVAPDGTDISSRAKRAAWMRESGCADYDDYKGAREKAAAEKVAQARGEFKPDKQLRDLIGRELYKRKMIL